MNIDSGDWKDEFPKQLTDLCYDVASYDPESRNEEDQWEQKELWINMHKPVALYSETGFLEGLNAEAFNNHEGVMHKCMTFLQDASKKIDKESGIWRLWDQPLAIPRASERLRKNAPKVKKELIPRRN